MELLLLSLGTGLTTMIGVIGVLLFGKPGKRILAFYLGLSAGIMVLLMFLELLPVGFAQGPVEAVGIGIGLGMFVLFLIHRFLQCIGGDMVVSVIPNKKEYTRMGLMLTLAIALHNIPEGMAIGAGYDTHHHFGLVIAFSIALHNIPEGIGLALPLVLAGISKTTILFLAIALGGCIPLGAWIGQQLFVGSPFLLTVGIGFACGAMGYIVWKEIVPTAWTYHRVFAQLGMGVSVGLMYLVQMLR